MTDQVLVPDEDAIEPTAPEPVEATETGAGAGRDVMLAFPHPGLVRAEFMIRVINLVQEEGSRVGAIADMNTGPAIGIARNALVKRFLESDHEWLWFLDSDMVPSLETLPKLLKFADPEERPVVGALCCVLHDGQVKASIYKAARDDRQRFAFMFVTEWPHDTLLQVDATGCGCLLMHRSVFARISEAKPDDDELWFTGMVIDSNEIGEDMAFCMRCAMAGIPVLVHTGVEVGHMKTLQIGAVSP